MWNSDVIAGLALFVSALAMLRAWYVGSVQTDLQERQSEFQRRIVELEERREQAAAVASTKARFYAHCLGSAQPGAVRFVVYNQGEANARNIRIQFDKRPISEHSVFPQGQPIKSSLAGGASFHYVLAVVMGGPIGAFVTIDWEDESGDPGHWESEVAFL